jgi:hypothetical protein
MCMTRCANSLRCNDFREVHSVPGRWLFLHSRWTWRIRLDSMPSHAKPAPVASKATAIASIPTATCRWAKLARQTTIATTPTAKRRRPGVFAPLFIDSPARARVVRWWSIGSREVSPMRTDYPDRAAKKRLLRRQPRASTSRSSVASCAATIDAAINSVCACSKTASKSAVLVGNYPVASQLPSKDGYDRPTSGGK